jgi:hypothetical protein
LGNDESMPPSDRTVQRQRAATLATAALVLAVAAASSDAFHGDRLRLMPRCERQRLAENLRRFDALGIPEQQALRDLDRQLAELSERERDHYLGLMRRYRIWLDSLPARRREEIDAAPPARRLELVRSVRQEAGRRRARARGDLADWVQVSALVSEPLRRSAWDARLWLALEPPVRARILDNPNSPAQRAQFLRSIPANAALAMMREETARRLGLEPGTLRAPAGRRPVPQRPTAKAELLARHSSDLKAMRDAETQAAVDPQKLHRFEDTLPPWVRASFDLLAPDAAERRMRVLYRLVFPEPEEIPGTGEANSSAVTAVP